MEMNKRVTRILGAVTVLGVVGVAAALAVAVDREPPAPSIAALAADEGAADLSGDEDPWAAHRERCQPVLEQLHAPTATDLERAREENQRFAAALDEAGVAYEVVTGGDGWEYLEPAEEDWEAFDSVMDTLHGAGGGLPDADADEMRAENDALAAYLDDAGVAYERMTEPDGWEHIEPVDDAGWRIMEEFWRAQERERMQERAEEHGLDVEAALACFDEELELSASAHMGEMFFPFPMDMQMASEQKALVEELLAAFDEAGIDYRRLDVPFIQWDHEDDAAAGIARRIAEEHGFGMMAEEEMAFEMGVDSDTVEIEEAPSEE